MRRGWGEEEEIRWGRLRLRPASHLPNLRLRGHLPLYNWPPAGLPFLLSDPGRLAGGKRWGGRSCGLRRVGAGVGEGEGEEEGEGAERLIKRGHNAGSLQEPCAAKNQLAANLDPT